MHSNLLNVTQAIIWENNIPFYSFFCWLNLMLVRLLGRHQSNVLDQVGEKREHNFKYNTYYNFNFE